jgi:predicted SprT family Zn-dependent metalloprotease
MQPVEFVSYATTQIAPTAEYDAFDQAFDFFNSELFGGHLPLCMITLNRKGRYGGYFSPERFGSRLADGERTDEIALNSDYFEGKDDKWILSVLVHEMAHLWQQHFGTSSRGGYHNKEWGAQMDRLGLIPSSTGEPGGKRTGQRVSHYIVEGGAFDKACDVLLTEGFHLGWQSRKVENNGGGKTKDKVKYTCPGCGVNAWGKADLHLVCGDCEQRLITEDEPLPGKECPKCGGKTRISTLDLDSILECIKCGYRFRKSELEQQEQTPVTPIDELGRYADEPERMKEQIRLHLQGLRLIEETEKAQEIVEALAGDTLLDYGLSFDYFEGEWLFDDGRDQLETGEAEDWADAIVQAYTILRSLPVVT